VPPDDPAFERGTAELTEVSLAWRATGLPTEATGAVPILALHGMCSGATTWDRFGVAAARSGRRVVALDLRGHGSSSRPGRCTCRAMRDDVIAFLDHEALERVDLVGHSLGGHVGTLVAQRQPDRVRRLVLEDISPPPEGPHDLALQTARQRVTLAAQSALLLTRARRFDVRMARPVLVEVLATPDPQWWAALPGMAAPTLLVGGGDSSHLSGKRLARLVQQMPDCQLVTVAGAGHRVHSRRPEQFVAAVLPFLAG